MPAPFGIVPVLVGVMASTALLGIADMAVADERGCRLATLKAGAKQARVVVGALAACEARLIGGKLPPATNCATETKTAKLLTKSADKIVSAIAKACGGKNKQCEGDPGPEGDVPLAAAGWGAGCPDLDQYGCTNALGDCGDVSDCLLCAARVPLFAAHASVHGALVLPNAKADKVRSKCQQAISKATTKLFATAASLHEKCWTARAKGKAGFAGACPAGDSSGKTAAALAAIGAKTVTAICKACGGADKRCGGDDDLGPEAIGFAPECRAVTIPGGASCEAPIASLADVAACAACVARFEAGCTLALAAPWGGAYPKECSPPVLGDDPAALFTDVAVDFDRAPGVDETEISEEPGGSKVVRTRLELTLKTAATAGELSALLAKYDASILMMLDGTRLVLIRIPDPGSVGALAAVVAALEAEPTVAAVSRDGILEPDILPPQYDPPPSGSVAGQPGLTLIDHLLAIRAPAAWNVRSLLFRTGQPRGPVLVLGDAFGNGPPDTPFSAGLLSYGVGHPAADNHGYQMLGTIGDDFGSPQQCLAAIPIQPRPRQLCATGIFPVPPVGDPMQLPERPFLNAIDLQGNPMIRMFSDGPLSAKQFENLLIGNIELAANGAAARAIVNTSVTYSSIAGKPDLARAAARDWIEKVRASGVEAKFLHFTSAGNHGSSEAAAAATNNQFTAAALLDEITNADGAPLANLQNIVVVESRRAGGFPVGPGDLAADGKRGGHVSAIGVDVFTSASRSASDSDSGSSFASAEVAGLAYYLAYLNASATPARLKQVILDTARAVPNSDGPKVVDAYAAVLAATDTDLTSGAKAPARTALLDLVPSPPGVFDAVDVQEFLQRLALLPDEATRIYTRFDLRGRWAFDTPFDLNLDGAYELVQQQVGPDQVLFAEGAISFDEEILCYYAFSPLYTRAAEGDDRGEELCCKWFRDNLRLPATAVCPPPRCPRNGGARAESCEPEEDPLAGTWRLTCSDGFTPSFSLLEDGTVTDGAFFPSWSTIGAWTTAGTTLTVDGCPQTFLPRGGFSFEGEWHAAPVPPEFGVQSCSDPLACPAMKGTYTGRNGVGQIIRQVQCDSRNGFARFADPRDQQCHGACGSEAQEHSWPHYCGPRPCGRANSAIGCHLADATSCPDGLVCRQVRTHPSFLGCACVPPSPETCSTPDDCPADTTCCLPGPSCGGASWLEAVCIHDRSDLVN